MSMGLKASFVSFLYQKYPELSVDIMNQLISEELISPFQVTLSQFQVDTIQNEIAQYWKLREWGLTKLSSRYEQHGLRKPNNYSVCMSYDFHINAEGKPELIEINTNAAFLALGFELYSFFKLANPAGDYDQLTLIKMFLNEISLCQKEEKSIAIIDENPEQQRLYIEFLLYKNLFEKNGIKSNIFNFNETEKYKNYSLVYNRYTDFYLQEEKSAEIKNLFNQRVLNLSPQPYEYFLLADKQRLLDWNQQSDIEKPSSLLKIYDLGKEDKDKIWSERKHLFFKPKTSFGSKQAYKGASMSRKVFDEVFNEHFVAQQLSIPSTVKVNYNQQDQEFKYDLRCFVYKNELQLIIARLYQGQTTNLKTLGGGFACVKINNA